MDDSQSSDVFSVSGEYVCNNSKVQMGAVAYESLVSITKISLSKNVQQEIKESNFAAYFSSLLEDCDTCISNSLDLIIQLLADVNFQLSQLHGYMEDAVCLLQMLSIFINNIVELMSMECHTMKTFPTTTGRIIMAVYTHCRDSESLYGNHLREVEKPLKDLFRTCHELQLTYLMVLEKHFAFDLVEKEELDILIDALDINLKIGDIVQTLDVKTMAEQWKAYTVICEKHSTSLMDTHVYDKCTKLLCTMIETNIRNAIETEQEDKIVLRSLKVASFTIKIMLKMCSVFRHATSKNLEHIIELLIYIYSANSVTVESAGEKSPQLINLMNTNVSIPSEALIRELVLDEQFGNCLLNYITESFTESQRSNDRFIGYIMLVVSGIKCVLQQRDCKLSKHTLIECIYKFIPYGHIWFNMGLKLKIEMKSESGYQTCGLYEYLLMNTLALAATLSFEEISVLEQRMYEAILSTECISALFSSNLWILLARLSPRQYLLSQLISLCKIYQKLDDNISFSKSPQQVHLSFTLSRLFEAMHSEDQIRLYIQFDIHDDRNARLWTALRISNLSGNARSNAQEVVSEKMLEEFHRLFTSGVHNPEEIHALIKTMKLAATCSTMHEDLEEYVVNAWVQACPNHNKFILSRGGLDRGSVWYLEFIKALVCLTNSMKGIFHKNSNVVKIFHVVSSMVEKGNTELKVVLISLIQELSICPISDENRHKTNSLLIKTFKHLLQETDHTVRHMFLIVLRRGRSKNLDSIISKVIDEDNSLEEIRVLFARYGEFNAQKKDLKKNLIIAFDYTYCHKCIEHEEVIQLSDSSVTVVDKTSSNNFDFVDVDTLFDTESDSEPACKKVKLNTDVEDIISRLENDTLLLCNEKENVIDFQYKTRIRGICEKLKNIMD